MLKAKLFSNGRSQAVRLPKEFRFKGDSVNIARMGKSVILFQDEATWDAYFEALDHMSADFMADGRNQPPVQEREDLFA